MQSASETGIEQLKELAADRMRWADMFVRGILDSVADGQLMARAGGVGNHTIWVMGHIAQSRDQLVSMAAGTERITPESWDGLFGGGSTPSEDRSAYPSRDELEAAMQATADRVVEWVQAMDEESAYAPTPDDLKPFAPNAIGVAITIAAHDLFHLGQVATVRSSLGLEPAFR